MQQGRMLIDRSEATGAHGMVAAKRQHACEAGIRMLEQGGNAVDAAIAAAFVSGVVEPMMSGLGGGGVMIVHDPADGQDWCVEYGMRSPALATPDCWELDQGQSTEGFKWRRVRGDANLIGHRSVAVPGAVAGYALAHTRWGKLPWSEVLRPAIDLARSGVPVGWYHSLLATAERAKLGRFPATAAIFLEDGAPPMPVSFDGTGSRLVQTDLAQTLEMIAHDGPAALYTGAIAAAIDAEMQHGEGLVRAEDLAHYQARIVPALAIPYRNVRVATVPGPFGGITMAQMLRLLDGFDLAALGHNSTAFLHTVAEASLLAFADRYTYLADPEVVPAPFTGLLDERYLAERRALIHPEQALGEHRPGNPWDYEPDQPGNRPAPSEPPPHASNTTHLCTADASGLAVSLTSTLMSRWGSGVVVPGTGIVLNNGMSWFDPEAGRAASVGPNRRPLTNQTPTMVVDAEGPLLAVGASGGRRILDAVAQLIIKTVDFGMGPQAAIGSPRMDCSERRLVIDDRVGDATIAALTALGHTVVPVENDFLINPFASPVAIRYDRGQGCLRGGADQYSPATAIGV